MLLTGVVVLVLNFRNSGQPRRRYGIAVTGTFVCTLAAGDRGVRRIRLGLAVVLGVFAPLLLLDIVFFLANVLKIPQGGYVPLVLGAALFVMMTTWHRGRELLFARFRQDGLPLRSFIARLPQSRTTRVPGTAVFMSSQADYLPGALLHNLKHNKVLHERVLFVTVTNEDVPEVGMENAHVEELARSSTASRCIRPSETPNIPAS